MKRLFSLLTLVAVLMVLTAAAALAQEPTYEDIKAKFGGTTLADWEAAGYEKEPYCVDASLFGQPQLGGMGFHAINPVLLDFEVNAVEPEVLMLDVDDNVIGVEYIVPSREQERPEAVGQPFHDFEVPGEPLGYALHAWLIDNPAGTFADFNPAVSCPPGSLPPPPELPETGGEGKTLPLAGGLLALAGGLALLAGFGLHQWRDSRI
jgi:LPXTG-motif cell wall-anchored protein